MTKPSVLEIDNLQVSFRTSGGRVAALNGVSFAVGQNEVLAVLGESGSGKSVTAASVMGLIAQPPGSIDGGQIRFGGVNLLALDADDHRRMCGKRVSLIFQDALSALNPVYPVGWQIAEVFAIHGMADRASAVRHAVELMEAVGIPAAAERAGQYPHQFSGGMCQRIMIAMAIALKPELIIADEPTTALDVTIQAQIVELLKKTHAQSGASIMLITHDLGLVAEMADRVVVMYAGRVVEDSDVYRFFAEPLHPYAMGLLASQPRIDRGAGALQPIPGAPPNPLALPSGCAFRPRCPRATLRCAEQTPALRKLASGRAVACHFADEQAL